MFRIKSKAGKIFLTALLALLLGSVIALISHTGNSPLSLAINTVTMPIQKVSQHIGDGVKSFCSFFKSSASLQKENAQLKQQIADYQYELSDYEDKKRTIALYEDFLGVKQEHPDFVFESAHVLSRDTNDIYSSFTLDKGLASGIEMNDPVIYGKNLVGIVTAVSADNCTVKTIANPDVNVAVYETRSNEIGYTSGLESAIIPNACRIPGLAKDSGIVSGGVVCTLGIGGIFPKDLIVGTVDKTEKSKSDISFYALVKSNVDFSSLTDVFVITDFKGQGTVQD